MTSSINNTFSAFRHRNYRLWFFGQLFSMIGTWMQSTAQGYLVYSLTGSTAYLGLVGFISGVPSWIFILFGGLIADRVSRRTLLVITQASMMALAFILAGLVFTGLVQPWHILVLSLLLGVANAFDTPARQAFVSELVSREDMTNAIALNATMFNTGAIIGPAVGGMVYALTGPGWCFTVNGISFLFVISALLMMHITTQPNPPKYTSAIAAIREGLTYVRNDRLVLTLSSSVFIVNVFGFGLMALVPSWAVNVLHGDVTTNGLMLSARGLGAVLGGLFIAALASGGFRGKIWTASSFAMPVVITLFALSRKLPITLLLLVMLGFAMITILNNSNAMVQSRVPDELRGRVMSLYSLMFMSGGPIGSLLNGNLASWTSEPVTAFMCAAATLVFALWIWFYRPEVRMMK